MTQTIIYRQEHCLWCGMELEHKPTGRAKKFCSASCRASYNRAKKRHARECVKAIQAGEPEPERDFGFPISIEAYVIEGERVTKRDRSRAMREAEKIERAGTAMFD